MELRHLEHFLAVARHLSFTRAAREIPIVQSTLSTSIQALERDLGAPLFERSTRRVALTPAGWALLPVAQRMMLEARTAREAVAAVSGAVRGEVAVGSIQGLTWVDLPAAISRFHDAHPAITFTLREAPVAELLDGVSDGSLDLAYIARDNSRLPEALVELAVRREDLVVIVAATHPLAAAEQVELPALSTEPFIDFRGGAGLQAVVERLCSDAGLSRRISCTVTQLELLVSLVRADLGIAVVPRPLADRAGLPILRIAPGHHHRTVALVARTPAPRNPAALLLVREFHGLRVGAGPAATDHDDV